MAQVSQSSDSNGQSTATAIIEGDNGGYASGSGNGSNGQEYYNNHGNNVDAVAPTVYGGTNPCGDAATFGISAMGVGISGGVASEKQSCTDRSWFVLTMTAAQKFNDPRFEAWGINIACQDKHIASAAPPGMCPGQQPQTAPVVAPIAAITPSYPKTVAFTQPTPIVAPVSTKPDWCGTWSKGDGTLPAVCQ